MPVQSVHFTNDSLFPVLEFSLMVKRLNLHLPSPQVYISNFWILAITAGLLSVYVALNWRSQLHSHLALSLVFLSAAGSCFWDHRHEIQSGTDRSSVAFGMLMIVGVLVVSSLRGHGKFLSLMPFLSALGLFSLLSGVKNLGQFWRELIILLTLGIPKLILPFLPDISPLTAQFSTFLLWYTGVPVQREGMHILVPDGGVQVVESCSGINLIAFMLGVAVIYLVMFPTHPVFKGIIPLAAAAIGFWVNGVRIALLVMISSAEHAANFEYWHSSEGALVFSMVSVILFGLFCFYQGKLTGYIRA